MIFGMQNVWCEPLEMKRFHVTIKELSGFKRNWFKKRKERH